MPRVAERRRVVSASDETPQHLKLEMRIAALEGQPSLRYMHRRANLEDVFLKLTGRDLRD